MLKQLFPPRSLAVAGVAAVAAFSSFWLFSQLRVNRNIAEAARHPNVVVEQNRLTVEVNNLRAVRGFVRAVGLPSALVTFLATAGAIAVTEPGRKRAELSPYEEAILLAAAAAQSRGFDPAKYLEDLSEI